MKYLIVDLKRLQFWKKNNRGYSINLSEAKKFDLEEALEKINQINIYDLMLVSEDKGDKIIQELNKII